MGGGGTIMDGAGSGVGWASSDVGGASSGVGGASSGVGGASSIWVCQTWFGWGCRGGVGAGLGVMGSLLQCTCVPTCTYVRCTYIRM